MKNALFFLILPLIVACEGQDGSNGFNSLVDISNEPAGNNCAAGGVKISSGIDVNENNVLDASEVSTTKFVCAGINGTNGTNGTNGVSGGPREVRLTTGTLAGNAVGESPTTPVILPCMDWFSKANFTGYDSAVYLVNPVHFVPVSSDASMIIEIVDMANGNTPIPNSQMILKKGGPYTSKNFFNSLPASSAKLGISVRTDTDNFMCRAEGFLLVIARK